MWLVLVHMYVECSLVLNIFCIDDNLIDDFSFQPTEKDLGNVWTYIDFHKELVKVLRNNSWDM